MDINVNAEFVANYCLGIEKIKSSTKRNAIWYNATVITAMTYGLLTLLVSFRVYAVLIKNRKMKDFSSTFYTVFIIASVTVRIRLPKLGKSGGKGQNLKKSQTQLAVHFKTSTIS
jgi:hypothetical protein